MIKKNLMATVALPAIGSMSTKDAPSDEQVGAQHLEALSNEMSSAVKQLKSFNDQRVEDVKQLKELGDQVKANGGVTTDMQKKIDDAAASMADNATKMQAFEQAIDMMKKEMEAPIMRNQKDLQDADREMAIQLQKRMYLDKGDDPESFKVNEEKLADVKMVRQVMRKFAKAGMFSKNEIIRSLDAEERKAFDAASMDQGFFLPEALGIEVDCDFECASLIDLYASASVSKSTFRFPHVEDYGDIGKYTCDAGCDAEFGEEGNITWKNGQTYDWRGIFCFQKDTLREANYDILGFMMRAVARSRRINRNQALITGDGVNEPLGWLTGDCFTKVAAPSQNPTHQDWRQFLASHPVELGTVTSTMHQNFFAYLASIVDSTGRFIYGDGLMGYSPSDVREAIRISNCLPDPTEGGTRGTAANPFVAGEFLAAAGNWGDAFTAVEHRPMFMELWEGGSTAWCSKWQFGAKDGGFVSCCNAARTFVAGAAAAG